MSEHTQAVIQFDGYRVSEIKYSCSPAFEFPNGDVSYRFNFVKCLSQISDTEIQENLRVNILFSDNAEEDETEAPYFLSVEIAGRFTSQSSWNPRWERNALAILFPYLRSIVSTVTSVSGRSPIVLPTVNIAGLFDAAES
jgi:preprotein translocase subunit SecB